METKRILVIEDNQKHLADAKAFFADKPEYQVDYATNAKDGCSKLFSLSECQSSWIWLAASRDKAIIANYDGVITDLFLPWSQYHTSEEPIGVAIAVLCRDVGHGDRAKELPAVILTAGFHHGPRYQWVYELSKKLGLRYVAANTDNPVEEVEKDWAEAIKRLTWAWNNKVSGKFPDQYR